MLSLLRRWIRDQPLSSGTSCVRRGLCSRRHSLWILLILLMVCIAIQTFVAHQARNDRITGLPHPRFTASKQHLFPTVQNVWEGSHSESSLAGKSEVAKVMPEDTFYFSIVRHPVAMMESIFMYYKSIPAFHKTHSLNEFLENSWRNYNSSVNNNHYAHNILAFDFGFDNNVTADAGDLDHRASMAIAAIEQDFHLILISEHFDESMILLKHALCWSVEDVVYFKLNSRSELTRHPLLPNTAEKIKRWNALDWRIYLHFNTTFWHKVYSLVGQEQMKQEVSQLRELQAKLANTCLKDGRAVDPSQIKDAGLKPFQYGAAVIQGYNLNPYIDRHTKTKCQRLITPELQYTDRLYTQQFPELAAKHRQANRIAPQHQHSNGASMARKAHQRQIIRRKFSNLKNQKASRSSLLTHTEANNKTKLP